MTMSLRGHDNSNYGPQPTEFEEVCLQARAEDTKWRSRCDMLRKTVPDPYSGEWKSSVAVSWESCTGNSGILLWLIIVVYGKLYYMQVDFCSVGHSFLERNGLDEDFLCTVFLHWLYAAHS